MSAQLSEEMGLDMRRDYVRLVLSVFYSVARLVPLGITYLLAGCVVRTILTVHNQCCGIRIWDSVLFLPLAPDPESEILAAFI